MGAQRWICDERVILVQAGALVQCDADSSIACVKLWGCLWMRVVLPIYSSRVDVIVRTSILLG
jgi:hypothetical protein